MRIEGHTYSCQFTRMKTFMIHSGRKGFLMMGGINSGRHDYTAKGCVAAILDVQTKESLYVGIMTNIVMFDGRFKSE